MSTQMNVVAGWVFALKIAGAYFLEITNFSLSYFLFG